MAAGLSIGKQYVIDNAKTLLSTTATGFIDLAGVLQALNSGMAFPPGSPAVQFSLKLKKPSHGLMVITPGLQMSERVADNRQD